MTQITPFGRGFIGLTLGLIVLAVSAVYLFFIDIPAPAQRIEKDVPYEQMLK